MINSVHYEHYSVKYTLYDTQFIVSNIQCQKSCSSGGEKSYNMCIPTTSWERLTFRTWIVLRNRHLNLCNMNSIYTYILYTVYVATFLVTSTRGKFNQDG